MFQLSRTITPRPFIIKGWNFGNVWKQLVFAQWVTFEPLSPWLWVTINSGSTVYCIIQENWMCNIWTTESNYSILKFYLLFPLFFITKIHFLKYFENNGSWCIILITNKTISCTKIISPPTKYEKIIYIESKYNSA